MQNVFDYLDWRGDLSFERDPFNEIDNLIFSILAYAQLDGIVPAEGDNNRAMALSAVAGKYAQRLFQLPSVDHNPFLRQIPALLAKAADSKRFGPVLLSNYVNQLDSEIVKQFSAVVFSINRRLHYVAFRGTDDSLAGWKEDFLMSFRSEVEAQKQADLYLRRVAPRLRGRLYLGGHSKGGNLAIFAATRSPVKLDRRIAGIYNNDGPGFLPAFVRQQRYQQCLPKIRTLVPQSSIVGMLLEHRESYQVIACDEPIILQHNPLTWKVRGTAFEPSEGLAKDSVVLRDSIRGVLDKVTLEQRAQFVNALFDIIHGSGARTVGDLSREKLSLAVNLIKTYRSMDSETQQVLKQAVELLFGESHRVLKTVLSKDLNALIAKHKPGIGPGPDQA
jgi:hypothetical protein